MPTYDYKCSDCENIQEEIHPMSGPDKTIVCSLCGKHNMQKMVAAPYTKFIGDWQTNEVRKIK